MTYLQFIYKVHITSIKAGKFIGKRQPGFPYRRLVKELWEDQISVQEFGRLCRRIEKLEAKV